MVVTVWTFYISLPHLPPLTDVTVHSFHNPPVLKIWHQCTFIFTIFGIKNAFSLLVECSYCAFIPSFKKSIDLLFEFGLGVWINLFHNIFQPKIFCIYIFSPLPIIVGSFSEFFVFITICTYVCQHWGTAQLVLSSPHRLHKTGEHPSWSPLHRVPPLPPAPLPRSACSRMKNISADTCSRQSQAGGVLSTYLHIYYLHIYTRARLPATASMHTSLHFTHFVIAFWKNEAI